MIDEDFLRDNPDLLDADDEPDEIAQAFDRIRRQVDDGLEDCDDKFADIMRRLPEELPPVPDVPPIDRPHVVHNQTPLNDCVNRVAESAAPMSDKARATLKAAGGASWQVLLGFGISFAVRVGVLGILLGSWLDKRFFGGQGFAAMAMILLAIVYSFYMLYRDVTRQDRLQKERVSESMSRVSEQNRDKKH